MDPAHVGKCAVGDIPVRHEVEGAAADRVPLLPLLGGQDLGRAVLGLLHGDVELQPIERRCRIRTRTRPRLPRTGRTGR